jgi:hypothetical protein
MTAYRKSDGQPSGSTGARSLYVPPGQRNPGAITTTPADELRAKMLEKNPTFDPADPDSMFHNEGRKFTAALKLEFLEHLLKWGRIGLSAHYVGVTHGCVNEHRKADKRFDQCCLDAMSVYREVAVQTIVTQAIEGHCERKWDREGNLLSERRVYETRLREMVLKNFDPSFVETQKQELTVQGGAVCVPMPTSDVNGWADVVASLENGSGPPSVVSGPPILNHGSADASDGKTQPAGANEPPEAFEPDSLTYLAASVPTTGWEAVIRRRPKRVDTDAGTESSSVLGSSPEETKPPAETDGSE